MTRTFGYPSWVPQVFRVLWSRETWLPLLGTSDGLQPTRSIVEHSLSSGALGDLLLTLLVGGLSAPVAARLGGNRGASQKRRRWVWVGLGGAGVVWVPVCIEVLDGPRVLLGWFYQPFAVPSQACWYGS